MVLPAHCGGGEVGGYFGSPDCKEEQRSPGMTGSIRFIMGGEVVTVADADPMTTVLEWLRASGRTGTKEGCAEGDCGACTVALGELVDGRVRYRAVNACIQFLPTLDGKQLVTVEDLKRPDGGLHPVQQAMVDCHGSQCGFCTPGFVMSMFALFREHEDPGRAETCDALAGNLCRCTGYQPILEAAERMYDGGRDDQFSAAEAETAALLRSTRRQGMLAVEGAGTQCFSPRSMSELSQVLAQRPEAWLLAGGTDVGLWVTKQHRRPETMIYLGEVAGLAGIAESAGALQIGAGAAYTDVLPAIEPHYPGFATLVRRLGSVQIRNAGTMGGNVANGSPIGDSMPALIAYGCEVVLESAEGSRVLPLEAFYLDYRKTALAPGEFVAGLRLPLPKPGARYATYKVSKRFDQDISAVAAGFAVTLDGETVSEIRAAYGGMAAIPKRATHLENALIGQPWALEAVTAALPALNEDFQPLTDMRASSGYRALVARNLVLRFYLESTGQADLLSEAAHG